MPRPRAGRPAEPDPAADLARRALYRFEFTEEYRRDERALAQEMRRRITVFLQARFAPAWRRGASATELNDLWDFKLLEGKEARQQQLLQLRPNPKYRVALIDVPEPPPPCIYFVGVFLKGKNEQDIARAAAAAARKRADVARMLRGVIGALEEHK